MTELCPLRHFAMVSWRASGRAPSPPKRAVSHSTSVWRRTSRAGGRSASEGTATRQSRAARGPQNEKHDERIALDRVKRGRCDKHASRVERMLGAHATFRLGSAL